MERDSIVDRKSSSLGMWDVGMYAVPRIPLIKEGDEIGRLIFDCASANGFVFRDGDILVVAHKVISKAEGAVARLADVTPSPKAQELSQATGRDPRLCEVYIRESAEILGTNGTMVVVRHRLGYVHTNAGVDRSNVAPSDEGVVVLLPRDPDESARRIRESMVKLSGVDIAVIVSDTGGRADREGARGEAIGLAGIRHLEEHDKHDLFRRPSHTMVALVDELAAAASAIMGETDESRPVIVIRGINYTRDDSASIRNLLAK